MSLPTRDLAGSRTEPRSEAGRIHEFGPFRLDPTERLLVREGQPVALTPKAFDLLVYLVERPGRLIEKQAIMAALWPDTVVEEANLTYNVSALRKALGAGHDGEQIIQTVPTRGYRFVASVREVSPERSAASLRGVTRTMVFVAVIFFAGTLAGGLAMWRARRSDSPMPRVVRFELPVAVGIRDITVPAVSQDGRRIVYSAPAGAGRQLYLRSLDSLEATAIPGTLGGHSPFFSPDGRAMAFYRQGGLFILDFATGRTEPLRPVVNAGVGTTWAPDGRIYYSRHPPLGLWMVPAVGGAPQALTTLGPGETRHGWPDLLPDRRHLIFGVVRNENLDDVRTEVLSLDTGERRTVLERGYAARFLPSGHLLYAQAGSLLAIPFDPRTLRAHGTPVRAVEGVATGAFGAFFSVSAGGTLVYHPGGAFHYRTEIVRLDDGNALPVAAPPGLYVDPSLSPDGQRVAISAHYGLQEDIWVYDLGRQGWTRITTDPRFESAPVWLPGDPDRIVFTQSRPGEDLGFAVMAMPADGRGAPEVLHASAYPVFATSSAPAAGLLAFTESGPQSPDLWLLDVREKPAARPFLQTPFAEKCPALSPDGRWLAYESDESGQSEIYVRPVSGDGKWQVSVAGGDRPRWLRDGRRIAYRSGRRIMGVAVRTRPSFAAEGPQVLAEGEFARGGYATPNYDISPDGRRFLVVKAAPEQARLPLVVVENWFAELNQKLAR